MFPKIINGNIVCISEILLNLENIFVVDASKDKVLFLESLVTRINCLHIFVQYIIFSQIKNQNYIFLLRVTVIIFPLIFQ